MITLSPGVKFLCWHDWYVKEYNTRTIQFESGKHYRLEHCRKCGSLEWRRTMECRFYSFELGYLNKLAGEQLWEHLREEGERRKRNPYALSHLYLPRPR